MSKKEKEHWFTEAVNKGCFETGRILSKGRRLFSGLESKGEPQDEKKEATGMLDSLSEKAENIVESVKKSLLGIGESFKSGYTDSPSPSKQAGVAKEKKSVRKSRSSRPSGGVSRTKNAESVPESGSKIQHNVESESLSEESAHKVSNETAEAESSGVEDENLEREIEEVTEHLPDIGDINKKAS